MELWLKAIHVMAIIAWMAGLFYLPRLYVYHCQVARGSEASELFKVMERKLLKVIMNPAMIVAWIFGLWLAYEQGNFSDGWFHVKLLLVVGMTVYHMILGKWRKDFETDSNERSETFYRYANEVPTVLMVGIVLLVILKPF